jgi:hypothetical protein
VHAEAARDHEYDDEERLPLESRIPRLFCLTINTVANRLR